jgi:hypothetical protein
MSSVPLGSEDPLPKSPGAASIPGDPFPWAPEAGQERAAAPTDPAPETPPEERDEDLFPRDLGEVD